LQAVVKDALRAADLTALVPAIGKPAPGSATALIISGRTAASLSQIVRLPKSDEGHLPRGRRHCLSLAQHCLSLVMSSISRSRSKGQVNLIDA
jgi:hypothetical protein